VPQEAVGDRGELFHAVALLDTDARKGDVVSVQDVLAYLQGMAGE
jgi:hypothetical protein